jgi:hypothetical protein
LAAPVVAAPSRPPSKSRSTAFYDRSGTSNSNHWSRRVTADNPHGFADATLARIRAIEDPVAQEAEVERMLARRITELRCRQERHE